VQAAAAVGELLAHRDEPRLVLHELAAGALERLLLAGAALLEGQLQLPGGAELLVEALAGLLQGPGVGEQLVALGADAGQARLEVGLLAGEVLQVALAAGQPRERADQQRALGVEALDGELLLLGQRGSSSRTGDEAAVVVGGQPVERAALRLQRLALGAERRAGRGDLRQLALASANALAEGLQLAPPGLEVGRPDLGLVVGLCGPSRPARAAPARRRRAWRGSPRSPPRRR
jgi:hypothetical protein